VAAKASSLGSTGRRARWRWLPSFGLDDWLAALFVLVSMVALADFMQGVGSADAGNVWTLLYLVAAVRLTQRAGVTWPLAVLRRYPALCFFLLVALASTVWSEHPSVTLTRSISMIGTSLMGIYVGHVLSQRRLMNTWLWTFSVLVALSVVLFLVAPNIGGLRIEDHAGRLRGLATGKNVLGPFLACAAVLSAAATLQRAVWPPLGIALTAMNVSAAYLAYSATSLVALTAGVGAIVALWLTRRMQIALPAAIGLGVTGAVAVAALAVANVDIIAQLLGKKTTLSGRTELWGLTFDALSYQPLIGFGHAAIWNRPETMDFLNAFSDDPKLRWSGTHHAHNGFVNTAIDLGIPVAVLLTAYVIKVLFGAIRAYYREPTAFTLFATGYVTTFIIANIGENHLLRARSGVWMFFVTVAVALAHSADGRRRSRRRRMGSGRRWLARAPEDEELRDELRSAFLRREQQPATLAAGESGLPPWSIRRRRRLAAASPVHGPHRSRKRRRRSRPGTRGSSS
jgi:exopolysaccharide production protein ExoQ